MEKLVFSCNWGKIPEYSWSGTNMGLYRELEKYYDIVPLNINAKVPKLFLLRCMEKIGLGRHDMSYMKYYTKLFCKRYDKHMPCKVFQMDECPNVPWTESYVYQDMSVSFLLDIYKNNPEYIPYLGLKNLSGNYLQKRVMIQNQFYENVNGIFTMGAWLTDYLVEHCGITREKVHSVGGGINVDASQIDDSKRTGNKILFVGRDYTRKGGDLVVKAFQILKRQYPDVELYIAGPQKNPIASEDRIDGLFFLGKVDRKKLVDLYNKCDLFCMPSRFEAYGLVFPEALVFGLPCIGRNAFSMKEFIDEGKNGYLIEDDNIQILSEKMGNALHDDIMKQYVRNNRENYITKYSWEKVVERIVKIMQ